ncbi:hypothetical protein [Thomasclavelia ramosa]|mgnify:FL=1|uniref:hypothetical protein n=1 Tax=Thomasclavelia ramosa TaxID=1547 RepID=UPI001F42A091|nr:hypothetical protein [Thomasclavelia ramosa]
MDALTLYKHLKQQYLYHDVAYKLICYGAMDSFIKEPTLTEYETIATVCIYADAKAEKPNIEKLANSVCKIYANKEYTLDELMEMSSWDVLELLD